MLAVEWAAFGVRVNAIGPAVTPTPLAAPILALVPLLAPYLPGLTRVPEVEVRLAMGVAGYPEHASDADELYMAADVALADAVESHAPISVAI